MLPADVLAATSSSDETTFSVPILVGAAAIAVGWVLLLLAVAAWRPRPGSDPGPAPRICHP